jgi:nucleotide-binding universal stress UspA family protein
MTVVVGFIPNQHGRAALVAGIAEARLRGWRLVVINATKGDALVDPRFATEGKIGELEAELSALDIDCDVRQHMGTDIAEQVLDVVRETDAQLLVIGIRHRTAVGKALWGSTSQRLLLECPCPVLAVKTNEHRTTEVTGAAARP